MSPVREVRLALAFLTRLPVAPKGEQSPNELGRSMAWFPLAGLALGLGLVGIDLLFPWESGSLLQNGLLMAFLVVATGALHLDGVADVCDGLAGGSDRERALRIMKDSQLGAFGVAGLVLVLVLKLAALTEVPEALRIQVLLLFPAAGRWLCTLVAWRFPYARPEGGTGQAFTETVGRREVLIATLFLLVVTVLGLGIVGILILFVLALLGWGAGCLAKRRFGGVTGDVLGAVVEAGEILCLILMGML